MSDKRRIDDLEDEACPYCGRFYFMPDEELLGMRHVHLVNEEAAEANADSRSIGEVAYFHSSEE